MQTNMKIYEEHFRKGWGSEYPNSELLSIYHRYIKNNLPGKGPYKMLDFGCGRGNNLYFFLEQKFDCYAIDITKSAIDICRNKFKDTPPHHFQTANIVNGAPLSELFTTNFDLIIASVSLPYLSESDLKIVLTQFLHIMSPGGILYASFYPIQDNFGEYRDENKMSRENHCTSLEESHYTLLVKSQEELLDWMKDFNCVVLGSTFYKFPSFAQETIHYVGQKPRI